MLALFKAVKGFDKKVGAQFKTYAGTCVSNAMASAVKKNLKAVQKSSVSIEFIDEERLAESVSAATVMAAEDVYIERERSALLAKQIQAMLSGFERQVLMLYLRGHSYVQIADLLFTTTKAVDNALQRVRRKLRPNDSPGNQP
jgi:RNA polymerase sporulation-specific sigma factor